MVDTTPASKKTREQTAVNLSAPKLYVNRELSSLEFFDRVLAQAADARHPLLERVKFLAIVSSNLDEFFMIRVSDLLEQMDAGIEEVPADGMTAVQQLTAIRRRVTAMYEEQHRIYREELLPQLSDKSIRIVDLSELTSAQRAGLRTYFEQEVFPVLTPLAVDPGHPFPHISNQSINLAVELHSGGPEARFARLKIPDVIPRLLHVEGILDQHVESKRAKYTFVWLDQLVAQNLSSLFPGVPVLASYSFRVVRDADIEIHEEEGVDLRLSMERVLRQRRFGEAVLLSMEPGTPHRIRRLLIEGLRISSDETYAVEKPIGLGSLMQLTSVDRPDLKYPPYVPRVPSDVNAGEPILNTVERRDVLVHHPYDSFAPVVDMLNIAARDDSVLAVKQTLYRVGTDAPVVRALLNAANHGKQVAVLVELKARFDEASNIEWARELERAGVHVVYGFVGLKTHAKVALVVRKEREGIRRDLHLGTGNYNVSTARGYTDLGLFTSDPDFGADATDLFNFLTGYSEQIAYRKFLVAPVNLRQGLLDRIEREIKQHRENGDGRLIFKMNSLGDVEFIKALYRASQAGVKIDLIVRGICCLRPRVPGVSENIRVTSIVGRFLEHSRVYYFHNAGYPEIYTGSADLLRRNLDNRVEVLFPIQDRGLQERIYERILCVQLKDTVNSWEQQQDGSYTRIKPAPGKEPFDCQAWSMTNGG
ncbi:MAG TPA: polyphosphate kinase 1 [Chloroflexota bacterium]